MIRLLAVCRGGAVPAEAPKWQCMRPLRLAGSEGSFASLLRGARTAHPLVARCDLCDALHQQADQPVPPNMLLGTLRGTERH